MTFHGQKQDLENELIRRWLSMFEREKANARSLKIALAREREEKNAMRRRACELSEMLKGL